MSLNWTGQLAETRRRLGWGRGNWNEDRATVLWHSVSSESKSGAFLTISCEKSSHLWPTKNRKLNSRLEIYFHSIATRARKRGRERDRARESRVPYNICVEFICRRYGFNVHPLCIKIHEIPQLQNEPNALFTPGETPFSQSRQVDGKGAGAVGREVPNFMVHLAWRL